MNKLILNWLAFLFMITVNILANVLPLGGNTTGEIEERNIVFFTPAGYAFSIWSVIYILLALWLVSQIPKGRRELPVYQKTNLLFVISSILNGLWLIFWHYEQFLISILIMAALLFSLHLLYRNLLAANASFPERLPFSVYYGWVSVAVIANLSFVLKEYDLLGTGSDQFSWTMLMLLFAALVAYTAGTRFHDRVYTLVFVWAFIAIGVENFQERTFIAYFTFILAALLIISIALPIKKRKKTLPRMLR
ncbi:tryptophan-rich sensory protein [Evansella sp. LMS18]|uniref:TspO/MBR family protein n=1 Tax=Evansella sp. LMS18 TaxID=2924033 RepID=UPI0020D1E658|nr:TspO/MBR family protein [Evansella sp. LMS18]UTR09773.1 tryptophan-rich sensory protein [Evansella sp. LMS18]